MSVSDIKLHGSLIIRTFLCGFRMMLVLPSLGSVFGF